jgi:hypothetical protein
MDVDALHEHAAEVLTELAGGDTSRFLDALGYLSAMVRDRALPTEARWHLLYFATAYIGAVESGRDSNEIEAAEVNALDDEDIASLCSFVADPLASELQGKHPSAAGVAAAWRRCTPGERAPSFDRGASRANVCRVASSASSSSSRSPWMPRSSTPSPP